MSEPLLFACGDSALNVEFSSQISPEANARVCALAQSLGVRQLVLWHTEDNDLPHRKARYGAERGGYDGVLIIPDDGEILDLTPAQEPV